MLKAVWQRLGPQREECRPCALGFSIQGSLGLFDVYYRLTLTKNVCIAGLAHLEGALVLRRFLRRMPNLFWGKGLRLSGILC